MEKENREFKDSVFVDFYTELIYKTNPRSVRSDLKRCCTRILKTIYRLK